MTSRWFSLLVTLSAILGFAIAFRWPHSEKGGNSTHPGSEGGTGSRSSSEDPSGDDSRHQSDGQARLALRALAAASASPSPTLTNVPTRLTEYQKLRFRYMGVDQFHQQLIAAMADRTAKCKGVNESPLFLTITFYAQMGPEGVTLANPRVYRRDGQGVTDEVRNCLTMAYGPAIRFPPAEHGLTIPYFEGDIETQLNWGIAN